MNWLRHNYIVVIFLAAILLSFVVSNMQSKQRDNEQRAQVIAGCTRTSERSVLDAAYKQKTSAVRRAGGTAKDLDAADEYQKFALGGLALIPLPEVVHKAMREGKLEPDTALLRAIVETTDEAGDNVYRLSDDARKIVRQGCVEAYS